MLLFFLTLVLTNNIKSKYMSWIGLAVIAIAFFLELVPTKYNT